MVAKANEPELLYYVNKSTGAGFISVDEGDSLINPSGKVIPNNDLLFEEVDEFNPNPAQSTTINNLLEVEKEIEENKWVSPDKDPHYTSYKDCNIKKTDVQAIKDGTKVLINPRRRGSFYLVDIKGLTKVEKDKKIERYIQHIGQKQGVQTLHYFIEDNSNLTKSEEV